MRDTLAPRLGANFVYILGNPTTRPTNRPKTASREFEPGNVLGAKVGAEAEAALDVLLAQPPRHGTPVVVHLAHAIDVEQGRDLGNARAGCGSDWRGGGMMSEDAMTGTHDVTWGERQGITCERRANCSRTVV